MPLDRSDTYKKVVSVLADQMSVAESSIDEQATLDGIGADSLDRVEIIMRLEEQFGVEIDDEKAEKLDTVSDIVTYVHSLRS